MKLHEYEALKIFSSYGIPVQKAGVASSAEEARRIAETLNPPYVVKAQVLVAGRGKAGGVKFAETPEEVEKVAGTMIGMRIKGLPVKKVLVAEKVEVRKEYYVGFTIDRGSRGIAFIVSSEGGVDIEEVAERKPEALWKTTINPLAGLQQYMLRRAAEKLGLGKDLRPQFYEIVNRMFRVFTDYDCELVESNPLALSTDGKLVAIDRRMIVDDNSVFRHPELLENPEERLGELTEFELLARQKGFSYVELDGNIGIIGNGAGLTMATMDVVQYYGGRPANFLDIGGGARADRVKEAVSLLVRHPNVKVLFVNILGGITRCDEVARGIVDALREGVNVPAVVRLMGTNEEEGRRILKEAGLFPLNSMEEAARKAVELAG